MDEGLLSLKWNNHKSTFVHLLKVLREKGSYTDVTLACGSKFFNVHRLVLMACSDFFSEVFEHTQCQKPVVVLKDIKSSELKCLLDYMYLGEVDVQQAELPGLVKAAECLRIKGLAVPDDDPTRPLKVDKPTYNSSVIDKPPKRRRSEKDVQEIDRFSPSPRKRTDKFQSSHTNINSTTLGQNTNFSDRQQQKSDCLNTQGKSDENYSNSARYSSSRVSSQQSLSSSLPSSHHQTSNLSLINHDANSTLQTDSSQYVQAEESQSLISHQEVQLAPVSMSYPEASDIKTEQCDSIEDDGRGTLKTETEHDDLDPGTTTDFSHFLTATVEESLAHQMFASANQPGPSGLHIKNRDDVFDPGNDDRGGMSGNNMYTSHSGSSMMSSTGICTVDADGSTIEAGAAGVGTAAGQPGTNVGGGVWGPSSAGLYCRESVGTHRCPYCIQSFMFLSILKRHLRTHTGEKPYQCPHCDYRSAYKYHVARHVKLHCPPFDLSGRTLVKMPPTESDIPSTCSSVESSSTMTFTAAPFSRDFVDMSSAIKSGEDPPDEQDFDLIQNESDNEMP